MITKKDDNSVKSTEFQKNCYMKENTFRIMNFMVYLISVRVWCWIKRFIGKLVTELRNIKV